MQYVINGNIKYNSTDGTLLCPDNELDTIVLMRIANELLLLFIQNNAIPLSREVMLNELWETKGLSASSNNLNNYVSMLRKALARCDCNDVITTIPKYGFLFDAQVEVLDDEGKEDSTVAEIYPDEVIYPSDKTNQRWTFFRQVRWRMCCGIFIPLAILFMVSLITYNRTEPQVLKDLIFTINNCHVYTTDDITKSLGDKKISTDVKTIVDNEKLDCNMKANIYYFTDKKLNAFGKIGMYSLLSYCPYQGRIPCDNYFISIYEK